MISALAGLGEKLLGVHKPGTSFAEFVAVAPLRFYFDEAIKIRIESFHTVRLAKPLRRDGIGLHIIVVP